MAENLSGGQRLGDMFRDLKNSPEAPQGQLIEAIKSAIRRKEIRPVEPEHAILTIISACVHFILVYPMLEMVHQQAADRPQFIEDRKQHIFDLIYHGLAA
jgi:TetR/AcrR family transcriptional regulator